MSRRGDLVTAVLPGELGKPRPALIVRSDLYEALPAVSVCPLTTTIRDDIKIVRVTVAPSDENGLRQTSQVLVDKITTIPHARVGREFGRLDDVTMLAVNRALAVYLAIA